MRISSRRLGEFLVTRRVLSRDVLDELLAREAAEGVHLSILLVRDEMVSEQDLTAAVASELGVPYIDLAERSILPDVWGLVPEDLARGYLAVALERRDDGIVVAMDDPGDEQVIAALEADLEGTIHPAVAVRDDLVRLIAQMYGPAPAADGDWAEASMRAPGAATGADPRAGRVQLDVLLDRVVALGGSDLHLTV